MKLKSKRREPLLRRTEDKDTPYADFDNRVELQIELKKLGLAPKLERGRVIVSG
jgi:hypothetical protein|tara:strand:+ start:179 stop:340 length:162 start_codon:yes stop_codon:yes gene_type:complete